MSDYIGRLWRRARSLDERESTALIVGVVALGILLFVTMIYLPAADARKAIYNEIDSLKRSIETIESMSADTIRLNRVLARFDDSLRAGAPPTLSKVENYILSVGIPKSEIIIAPGASNKLGRYTEQIALVTIRRIRLGELVTFFKILREKDESIRVKRLTVTPYYSDPAHLRVNISLSLYEKS